MQPRPGLLTYSGLASRSGRPEAVWPSEAQASWVSKGLFLNDKHIFSHETGFVRFESSYTLPLIGGYAVQTDTESVTQDGWEQPQRVLFFMCLYLPAPLTMGLYEIKQWRGIPDGL